MCIEKYRPYKKPIWRTGYKYYRTEYSGELRGMYNTLYYEVGETYKAKNLPKWKTSGMMRDSDLFGFHVYKERQHYPLWPIAEVKVKCLVKGSGYSGGYTAYLCDEIELLELTRDFLSI